MDLLELLKKLIQIDELKRTIGENDVVMKNDVDYFYNIYFERFQKRLFIASEQEKEIVDNFLNNQLLKYNMILRDLINKKEVFSSRKDIVEYIEKERLEAQTNLEEVESYKRMIGREIEKPNTI